MKTEDFYPPKCPICYYNNTCHHKGNPSPTRGCYTHKRDCLIWAGNNPTTAEEGNCTCGFNKFNFNRYFYCYYENPKGSQLSTNQPELAVFCQINPETSSLSTRKNPLGICKKQKE